MHPPLSVLAVDDEEPALDELAFLLRRCAHVADVATAGDANAAVHQLQERSFDAVLLDIRMPGLDGLELARLLRRFSRPPAVIFVTAFDEYALEAFEVHASDYLRKPPSASRLAAALEQVRRERGPEPVAGADGHDPLDVLPVETGGRTRLIERGQVCWAEAAGDYLRLHTLDGGSHLVRLPISLLEDRWAEAGFARIHRGYLVALRHVTELRSEGSGWVVRVAGRDLPVSRRHSRELRDRLVRAPRRVTR